MGIDDYLDYPEFKEKYPDKDMGDWQKYRGKRAYQKAKKEFEEHASKFTKEQLEDFQKDLDYLKDKYGS